jgi:hypothetical protein
MAMSQDFVSSPERMGRPGTVRLADWRQWVQPMKRLLALGVVALVIGGCGGDEKSAATVPAAVTTSVADTTAPTTTSAPLSTSTTAVAETTTLPATTTTVATEDLIKQAVQDYFEAYQQCGTAPATCVPADFTATEGPSRAIVTEFAQGLAAQGLYFSTDRRGMYLVVESVTVSMPSEATAMYCVYDPGIVLGATGPDGLPTVVNDQISSIRYSYGLFLEEGLWRVGRQHELERLGEGSLCPPSE